ncbi:MAG: alpha/beta hydrolase [Burkholderiales bacterium]|nr:alpha/beta hydrolase [Burkholderiales bacterium]
MIHRCLVRFLLLVTMLIAGTATRSGELPPDIKTLPVNGYEMAYLERGTGAPVVLVHGTLSDYRTWSGQTDAFSERFRTIAVSLRRYYPERWDGKGDHASLRQHATDLATFIATLGAGPVHVVGHSRGGDVVLLMASAHPELLRSVVLMDPSPLQAMLPQTANAAAEAEKRREFIAAAVERLDQGDVDGGLERFIDGVLAPGAWQKMPDRQKEVIRDNAYSIKSLPTDARTPFSCGDAGRIARPVLLVTGEKSPRPYGLMLEAIEPCLESSEKVTIPNAAHAMHLANPVAFNAAVLQFLERH